MGLLEELEGELALTYEGRCPIRKWLLTLDDDTRSQVEAVIKSDVPAPKAAAFLGRKFPGLGWDDKPLQAHRRAITGRTGGCKCQPS